MRWMAPATVALLLLAVTPLATAEMSTTTTCTGGTTDGYVITMNLPSVQGMDLGTATVYVAHGNWGMWEETNGQSGLQRTPKLCSTVTSEDGVIVSSYAWVDYTEDYVLIP